MADVGISYSHIDTPIALELRAACLRAGLTVWMDDPRTDDHSVAERGIPIGRAHWSVIEREFAGASVNIALDTAVWRKSDYCQKENNRSKELGKWIVKATPASIEDVVRYVAPTLAERRQLLVAHARIATRVVAGDPPRTVLQRWQEGSLSADARLVLGDLTGTGLSLTAPIGVLAAADIRADQLARRRLRSAAIAVVSVLAVLAIGAGVALLLANRFSSDALASANRAEARTLAAQSAKNADSLAAITQAKKAVSLDPSGPGVAALAAATIADKRLRAIVLPPDSYLGATWVQSSPVVLAYTATRVVALNAQTGVVKAPITVTDTIFTGMFVAGPDGRSAVYVDSNRALVWLDLSSGTTRPLGVGSVFALGMSDDGTVWWGTRDSKLSWAKFPANGTLSGTQATMLPTIALAVDAKATEVSYVGDDAQVHLLRRSGLSLSPESSVALNARVHGIVGGYRASISDCGGVLYGSYEPSLRGVSFQWNPKNGDLSQTGITRASAPVCMNGKGFSSDATRGVVQNASQNVHFQLPSDTDRYFSVSDPGHKRIAELSPTPARLFVINPGTMAMQTGNTPPVEEQIVFNDRVWQIGEDDRLVDAATGRVAGSIPGIAGQGFALAQYVQRIGCDAIVTTETSLFHVGCDGTTKLLPIPLTNARDLRAGSDGKHFVLTTTGAIRLLNLDGSLDTTIPAPWAAAQDLAQDADISPDGLRVAAVDSLGKLHFAALAHPIRWTTEQIGVPAGGIQIAFVRGGDLLMLGPDKRLRLVNKAVTIIAVQRTVTDNERLRVEGGEVIISSLTGEGAILDERTLAVKERLPNGVFELQADGTLRGLALYSDGSSSEKVSLSITITMPPIAR